MNTKPILKARNRKASWHRKVCKNVLVTKEVEIVEIEVFAGWSEPSLAEYLIEVEYSIIGRYKSKPCQMVQVGIDWLKDNLTEKEMLSFITERLCSNQ